MMTPRATPVLHDALVRCVYFERTTAHVLMGALPRIADLDTKLVLGRHQQHAMVRSVRLERALHEAARIHGGLAPCEPCVPQAWRDFMVEVDGSAEVRQLVHTICIDIKTDVLAAYRATRAALDAAIDAPLVQVVNAALRELELELRWARRQLGVARDGARRTPAGTVSEERRSLARDRWLWQPLARAPRAVRPEHMQQARKAGASAIPFVGPGLRVAGAMLHENIDAEITTMELFARCSYEHPDLPEAFHRDMSRQASDESRHARGCMTGAAHYGTPHGTWPVSTDVYDFHYEYAPCEPGSKHELLWRLLLRSTLQEALSLDSFGTLSARLVHDGAHDAARIVESITADEVFHVEAGLKWSRFLCGGDDDAVFRERAAAHRYFFEQATRARRQFVKAEPEAALRETEQAMRVRDQARAHYPFDLRMRLAKQAREAAGFTQRDLEQVVGWGYAHP